MPKVKREATGTLSKSERQKLRRLHTQGGPSYGSVRNLVKDSNLSVSKVRQFLHSKITFATRELQRRKVFALFHREIWCKHLADINKLAKDNHSVKYLIVRQNLFDRKQNIPKKWFMSI